MSIVILHTADLHIGDRRYGRFDPQRSINTRLDDQRRSLQFLADAAQKEGVHVALLVGDIYHSKSPTPAEEDVFAEFVANLVGEDIHVFAIEGNHERPAIPDRASPLTHIATLGLDRFHHISEPGVEVVEIKGEALAVAAIPWPHRRELIDGGYLGPKSPPSPEIWDAYIEESVDRLAEQIPDGAKAILAAHLWTANVRGIPISMSRGEPICRADSIARPPFDYVALGHIHRHQEVWPDPPAVYSGSIERTDFTEANIAKGAVIVELGRKTTWKFLQTPARKFVDMKMDLSGMTDPAAAAATKLAQIETDGAIVRLNVTQMPGDRSFDARHLRHKFPSIFYLRVVRVEVDIDRKPVQLRTYSPLDALDEFIDRDDELKPHKTELIELAKDLLEEVRG